MNKSNRRGRHTRERQTYDRLKAAHIYQTKIMAVPGLEHYTSPICEIINKLIASRSDQLPLKLTELLLSEQAIELRITCFTSSKHTTNTTKSITYDADIESLARTIIDRTYDSAMRIGLMSWAHNPHLTLYDIIWDYMYSALPNLRQERHWEQAVQKMRVHAGSNMMVEFSMRNGRLYYTSNHTMAERRLNNLHNDLVDVMADLREALTNVQVVAAAT